MCLTQITRRNPTPSKTRVRVAWKRFIKMDAGKLRGEFYHRVYKIGKWYKAIGKRPIKRCNWNPGTWYSPGFHAWEECPLGVPIGDIVYRKVELREVTAVGIQGSRKAFVARWMRIVPMGAEVKKGG